MYGWVWRHLPGPLVVRLVLVLLAVAGVAVLCFTVLYPAIAPLMPFNDTTVGEVP